MRLSAGRVAYHHGNRLGYLGYGQKPRADVVGPSDMRAFRNIKVAEVPGWVAGRPKDFIYAYYAGRRYWLAWLYKYSRPGMQPIQGQKVGQYGYPGNFNLSGSGIAMAIIATALFMQLVVCYKENVHHRFKKYHSYPLSETLMAYLPLNYKSEDIGGNVAVKAFAIDFLIAGALVNAVTASKYAPTPAMASRRQQSGFMALGAVAVLMAYQRVTFKSKSVPLVDEADRAGLAALLGCEQVEVEGLLSQNEEMKNPLRYSMFTNMFTRLYDSVFGLMA